MHNRLLLLLLLHAGISNASDELVQTSPCPGLVSSYDVEKFEQVLVVTDADFASIEDCEQLGGFFFTQPRRQQYSLDYSGLASIVDNIWQPVSEDAPLLFLDALLSWMKDLGLEEHADTFRDFISTYMPAEESVQLFFTIIIWLIVIAVLALVLYEFYRAGMLRLPRSRHNADDDQQSAIQPALEWQSVMALPLREQISALLRYSIDSLSSRKLLPASNSFTNHELIACLEQTDARKVPLLREQIELTEPVVYGNAPVTEAVVSACRAKVRDLNDA